MSDKRCSSCECWNAPSIHADFGWCESEKMQTRVEFGCIFWKKEEPDLREQLAAYAHDAWSGWIVYLFERATRCTNGQAVIDSTDADRWTRQCKMKYGELPEWEKESDRDEADKMIAIFEKWQQKGEK